jgi:hypothetical protein
MLRVVRDVGRGFRPGPHEGDIREGGI